MAQMDFPGMFIRFFETTAASKMKSDAARTAASYGLVSATTVTEELSRVRLDIPYADIDFDYYNICSNYIYPFKRRACQNKYNYLKESYDLVQSLSQMGTLNRINKGVKEQIGEKYVDITNTIVKELEEMKHAYEEEAILGRLGFGAKSSR